MLNQRQTSDKVLLSSFYKLSLPNNKKRKPALVYTKGTSKTCIFRELAFKDLVRILPLTLSEFKQINPLLFFLKLQNSLSFLTVPGGIEVN